MAGGQDTVPQSAGLRAAFLALHIAGGYIGIPILVLTFFFSKRVQRPATVINFCITWIIYSVSYTLLFLGGYHNTHSPPFELCLTQAAMIHGAPPMAVVAGLGVVAQAYTAYQLPWQNWHPPWISFWPDWLITTMIVLPPYIAFLVFALISAMLGHSRPEDVSSNEHLAIYCTFKNRLGPYEQYAVPGFCAGVMVLIITLLALAISKYCRGWRTINHAFPLADRRPTLSPLFRVSLFSLYSVVVLAACVSYLFMKETGGVYMIQAALPIVATIVFATQMDIMSAWAFWKREDVSQAITNPGFVPGGGWSRPNSAEISPQLMGHVILSSGV
ncbi:hypothetical protein BDW22DRAFT_1424054 [Trametopsis cervina]|nr:hypothetical protein BDW22DRAFT_1424054 [Trametopsis cervina]